MSLTPDEAAKSLRDVQSAERRSRQAYGYSLSAPYLFMRGTIWMAGYSATAFLAPRFTGWIWLGLIATGIIGSCAIGRRQHSNKIGVEAAAINRRMGGTAGIIYAFTAALFFVLQPTMNVHDAASYWMWNKVVPILAFAIFRAVLRYRPMDGHSLYCPGCISRCCDTGWLLPDRRISLLCLDGGGRWWLVVFDWLLDAAGLRWSTHAITTSRYA